MVGEQSVSGLVWWVGNKWEGWYGGWIISGWALTVGV